MNHFQLTALAHGFLSFLLPLVNLKFQMWVLHASLRGFVSPTLLTWIVSTRSSPFSICEKVLHGINPTPHIGMSMMCNNLLKDNLTNKGCWTSSRCLILKLIPLDFNFLFHSINQLIFFHLKHVCKLLKMWRFTTYWFCCLDPQKWVEQWPYLFTSMSSPLLWKKGVYNWHYNLVFELQWPSAIHSISML
jgi:hypothetical protein